METDARAAIELPGSVADSLYSVVYNQRAMAYLQVDARGTLIGAGGYLANYGLDALELGAPAHEQVYFVDGFLPLVESPFFVHSMEVASGRAADLQFYADGDNVWILLFDVTTERDATQRVQQKAYEMTLLQEKEALLNRSLEAANAALRVAQRDLEQSREALLQVNQRLEVELREAATYVRSLLPAPMTGPISADWRFVPSTELGGDCFGYHWIDEAHFALYLLDVCGHGVGPSLLSVGVLNTLRSGSLLNVDVRDPASVMTALNSVYQMEQHNELYFTLWYGVYQPASRRLDYAGAGHPPAVLIAPGPGGSLQAELLKGKGLPIGLVEKAAWSSKSVTVPQRSRLFVLSDGSFEVDKIDGTQLTFEEFVELLRAAPEPGESELDRLLRQLRQLHGADTLDDDFSIVKFEF